MATAPRRLAEADLMLVGTVVGLVEEADLIDDLVDSLDPDRLALGVSPGELATLQAIAEDDVDEEVEIPLSKADEAYAEHLSRFGKVRLPPPAYIRTIEIGRERGLDVTPLDLEEEAFSKRYTETVGVFDLIRKSRRERRLAKRGVEADNALDFARQWEDRLLEVGGIAEVEQAREAHMARRLRELCREPGRILAVVDSVRREGIARRLWPDRR